MIHYKKIIIGLCAFVVQESFGARLDLIDKLTRPGYTNELPYQFSLIAQTGFHTARTLDEDGNKVNVLQIFEPEQNALAMLNGFDDASNFGQLRSVLDASDDGTRGHFGVSADLKSIIAISFGGRFCLADAWSVISSISYHSMALKNVIFQDMTQANSAADVRVKELLTNNFVQNVSALGNIDITEWRRSGFGDWRTDVIWEKAFIQNKPFLKKVIIEWHLGLSVPTGKKQDEDKLFAQSFGYDGSFAVPFGFALDAQLGSYFKVGFDVELTHAFGNTRPRRIKTSMDQTEFLLLQKLPVHKDFGLDQCFNLYLKFYNLLDILSCTFGYQFFKHGDDELSLKTNRFSQEIANSARSLEEWTKHKFVIHTNVDDVYWGAWGNVSPQFSLFVQLPFNGKKTTLIDSFGGSFSVSF